MGEAMCRVLIELPPDVQGHCSATTCDPALGRSVPPGTNTENGTCAVCALQQLTPGAAKPWYALERCGVGWEVE
jgi:hypothetical protein